MCAAVRLEPFLYLRIFHLQDPPPTNMQPILGPTSSRRLIIHDFRRRGSSVMAQDYLSLPYASQLSKPFLFDVSAFEDTLWHSEYQPTNTRLMFRFVLQALAPPHFPRIRASSSSLGALILFVVDTFSNA
jgi:hypothetical protein